MIGNLVKRLPTIQNPKEVCPSCISGKHSRTPFPSFAYRATKIIQIVHMDICGPINPPTLGSKKYFLIADDYSICMWVSLVKEKYDPFNQFKHFKSLAEVEKRDCVRSDRGGELIFEDFKNFCDS